MKISSLLEDARIRPNLFHWNGRMDSAGLQTWLDQNRWLGDSPADLLAFWQETGGGDIFETETILGPLSGPNLGDDITTLNRDMRSHGMMDRFVVYHMGLLISAYDKVTGDYVELDPSDFHVARRFASFDDWYRDTLRVEYQHRYQLQ